MMNKELLRRLPKVDELLNQEKIKKYLNITMRNIIVDSIRETICNYRNMIIKGRIDAFTNEDIINSVIMTIEEKDEFRLRKVINATGTVIHTNMGRSLLSKGAVERVIDVVENYNNLEYDINKGKRGLRYSHIEEIITKITGAEAAMVVNNNASAVMLVLSTLCYEKEAIVSRGQLVEIGGSFRVPEVMKLSGAKLVEVGTTNRTHLFDYENNISEDTGVLLKVHTSNYKILGFTEEVPLDELVELGKEHNIPVIEDIGSGVLVDFSKYGFAYEPTVQESIKKGVDVVTFSGDKMLGGPQAGIIVGKKKYIDKMKKNQLTRALRIDKMTLAALEGTLKYYLDEEEAIKNIPTLSMILADKDDIMKKAQKLKEMLEKSLRNYDFNISADFSMVGGGSMPTEKVDTYVIRIKSKKIATEKLEYLLRMNKIPIIVRVCNDEIILDLRTIFEKDFNTILDAFQNAESKL
nr:L-seryl-tRNA(Sec) selenium transferase [Clostridium tepidiprofundi]